LRRSEERTRRQPLGGRRTLPSPAAHGADVVARGGLGAVPGAASEGGHASVRRRIEELEHVVEDLVREQRCALRRVTLLLHPWSLELQRRLVVILLRHRSWGGGECEPP
jgi:hypothetical protein